MMGGREAVLSMIVAVGAALALARPRTPARGGHRRGGAVRAARRALEFRAPRDTKEITREP